MRDKETIEIVTEFIRLDGFLKFAAVADSGGGAKAMIQDAKISVNGETCFQRGRKIYSGDTVTAFGKDFIVRGEAK